MLTKGTAYVELGPNKPMHNNIKRVASFISNDKPKPLAFNLYHAPSPKSF